jgi:uroporphyrinogen III methyltransferase / synthase
MSLHGRTILITRRQEQSRELSAELEKRGARTLVCPMIGIAEPESWSECDLAIDRLGKYDGIIFTSSNGAEMFFRRLRERGGGNLPRLQSIPVFAVGEKTRQTIADHGVGVEFVPAVYSGDALGQAFAGRDLKGKTYLHPRGNLGREEVERHLTGAGARVEAVVVYSTVDPDRASCGDLRRRILSGAIDVVTFASPSALKNFTSLFTGPEFTSMPGRPRVVVIGPTTAEAARSINFPVDAVAPESTSAGLVRAVEELFQR